MRKKTTQQFIQDAYCKHGDTYNYKLVDYKNSSTKIKIICPLHGSFNKSPNHHLKGQGCPECSKTKETNKQTKTTQQFIQDAYCIHQDKYNYRLVDYKNSKTKIKIICPVHAVFEQQPTYHLSGRSCPECGKLKQGSRKSEQQFIQDVYCKHGDTYNYKLVDYKNSSTKVKIICPLHGIFEQEANSHLSGQGCKKCAIQRRSKKQYKNTYWFIRKSKQVHADKYDYSLVEYKNNLTKVKIICPVHGIFKQKPIYHLQGQGCQGCGIEYTSLISRKSEQQFIQDAYCIHQDKYNYRLVDYINSRSKIKIICPVHGIFEQESNSHLQGKGCPKCTSNISKQEIQLQDWLKDVMKKHTKEQFIQKAKQVHQDKYDYSLVDYKNSSTKVKIICPLHGSFDKSPNHHLKGQGCFICSKIKQTKKQTKTTQQFIQDAYCKHGDTYNYKLVEYKDKQTKVKIICPVHGVFEQQPTYHLSNRSCPECGRLKQGPRKSEQQFIHDVWCRHGDTYNYKLVDYKNSLTKVKIICPVHGVFEQSPNQHLYGQRCPKCYGNITKTTEKFIQDAYCKHGDTYNYRLVDYINDRTKVKIICHMHGIFEQSPNNHLRGQDCHKCASNISKQEIQLQEWLSGSMKKHTIQQFVNKAKHIHQDKYDYSLVDYKNSKTKVKIICPFHGIFEQVPGNHLQGQGCPKCINKRKSTEQFIQDAWCIHQDKYNYKLVDYNNNHKNIKMVCPVHAVFEQQPQHHLNGSGCPDCAVVSTTDKKRKSTEQFIQDAWCIHQDRYNYSLVDYKNCMVKVKIICPIHGIFEQRPNDHLYGSDCPKCTSNISKQEIQLQEWLKDIDIICNDRELIKPYELDIVIPYKKICIEYNGLYWHSEQRGKDRRYHLNKYNLCKDKGYRLIQIWENEWLYQQDIVKSIILNAIGINKRVIHGRKCVIRDVQVKDARIMYDDNHIQGFKGGTHKGLYFNDELVSLMSIDKRNELQRFVNLKYTKVHGAFSKLLKSFIKDGCKDIYTFADLRYFTGNVYANNGFNYIYTTPPNYYYFKGMNVFHRMHFQKKNIQKKFNQGILSCFDINKTEYQNMLNNTYDRIWDCGNMKFILK